jgi:hypothetical protein
MSVRLVWLKRGKEIDEYDTTLLVNDPSCDLNTYNGNASADSQILHQGKLCRSDGEKMSNRIVNTAGGTLVGVVGIGGQQKEGGTYKISLLPSSITLLIATHRCQQCQQYQ